MICDFIDDSRKLKPKDSLCPDIPDCLNDKDKLLGWEEKRYE